MFSKKEKSLQERFRDLSKGDIFDIKRTVHTLLKEAIESYGVKIPEQKSYTIDLGTARDYEEITDFRETNNLVVVSIDGAAQIKLNSPAEPAHDLTQVQAFPMNIKRIFIYNTAQAGKTLVLKAGGFIKSIRDMEADIASMQGDISSLDSKVALAANQGKVYVLTASDTERLADDAEESTWGSTEVKKKQFTIMTSGIVRFTFDLKVGDAAYTAYGIIKINGIQVWSTTTQSTTYVPKSRDVAIGEGDLLQLWIKCSGEESVSCRNAKVKCDQALGAPAIGQVS